MCRAQKGDISTGSLTVAFFTFSVLVKLQMLVFQYFRMLEDRRSVT